MKTFVISLLKIFLFSLIITGCVSEKREVPHLSYHDSTLIQIKAYNVIDTVKIYTQFCSLFPFRPCQKKYLEVTKSGTYYLTYRLTKPELLKFNIGESFEALMLPGDTLTIEVGSDKDSKDKVNCKFSDKFNDYFQAKKSKFGYYTLEDARNNILKDYFLKLSVSGESFKKALNILSEAEKQNLEFLSEEGKDLPRWFFEFEKANINYGSAYTKLLLYSYLSTEDKKSIAFPNIQLINSKATLSTFYYYYVFEYLNKKFPRQDFNASVINWRIDQFKKSSHFLDSIMKGESRAYYNAVSLADLYFFSSSREDLKMADSFINENFKELNEHEKILIDYDKRDVSDFLKLKDNLPAGDAAPRFYLKDSEGVARQVKDFNGKVIYLHFWATWCAPCIKEIPALNQLKSKLKNQPFELVNICMDDNPEKWSELIGSEKLEGINLICKGSWDKSLSEQYFINELPHYAIVDQEGKILQNNCGGPEAVYPDLLAYLNRK